MASPSFEIIPRMSDRLCSAMRRRLVRRQVTSFCPRKQRDSHAGRNLKLWLHRYPFGVTLFHSKPPFLARSTGGVVNNLAHIFSMLGPMLTMLVVYCVILGVAYYLGAK